MMNWLIGALCALLVSAAAFRKGSLSKSGMIAAFIMGTVYYGAGSLFWFGILLLFFITSSVFSKFREARKRELEKSYAKSGRRDAGQVFANGGIGMLLCIANAIWPDPVWVYLFAGVMASVTADTWATEWGGLSRSEPRSVLTFRRVPAGTSGGVSLIGSTAALAGAVMIGGAAWLLPELSRALTGHATVSTALSLWQWLIVGGLAGFAGSFVDSLLGATAQRMYRCSVCGKSVEVLSHCGAKTIPERGLSWMNNDAVNLISSMAGGCIAWGLAAIAIMLG